jgi:response regulator RpfG family c-di-GMP phosphodiesterase
MSNILIVDDDSSVRSLLRQILVGDGHDCLEAADAAGARELLESRPFDLVVSDVMMPGESGLDLAGHVRSAHPNTAVVLITAVDDLRTAGAARNMGVYNYVVKPSEVSQISISVADALWRREEMLKNLAFKDHLNGRIAEQASFLKAQAEKLREVFEKTILSMALAVEKRDLFTSGHQKNVAALAREVALNMNLSAERVEAVYYAGLVHDLGKISIPADILAKPTKLSEMEFNLVKRHPEAGYEILCGIEFPWPVAPIILQHHERLDGSGYPLGLKDGRIRLEARILAVADVIDAMSSHRPYRPAHTPVAVKAEIRENAGRLYDVRVVKAALAVMENPPQPG